MDMQDASSTANAGVGAVVARWWSSPSPAVIFDFNGTLSDDEPILLRLFTDMFAEHLDWALTPGDYFGRLAGLSDREIIETVVADLGVHDEALVERLLGERRTRYCALVEERSPILPATVELVQRLHALRVDLAIVTGAQRIDVEFVLERSPLAGLFPVIVTEEDVVNGKPHPEGFLTALDLMDVPASSVLVFEDSLHGLAGARAAGMHTIAVEGTRSATELSPAADGVVARLEAGLLDDLGPGARG
jgi:beta-phosphoglucomutase